MRCHAKILSDAGGPHAVVRLIQGRVDADEVTLQKRVRAWAVSDSIPGEYWKLLADNGVATVEEFALSAAIRKGIAPAASLCPELATEHHATPPHATAPVEPDPGAAVALEKGGASQ